MASEKEIRLAKDAYESFCSMLDNRGWVYDKDDSSLYISVGVTGDDLPMDFEVVFDVEYQIARMRSILPFKMNKEKMIEGSIATNSINYLLADGSFDFNLADGTIAFRLTTSFKNSLINERVFAYMVDVACTTIDEYNDKLLMLSKGMIKIEDIIK